MTDYADGRNVLLRRPEPGRPVHPVVSEKRETQNVNVDTNAIADAVIKAIVGKSSGLVFQSTGISDKTNNADSLSKLADAMVYNSDKNESNLEGLGRIQETKKDNKDTDKTIDLLSQLGD